MPKNVGHFIKKSSYFSLEYFEYFGMLNRTVQHKCGLCFIVLLFWLQITPFLTDFLLKKSNIINYLHFFFSYLMYYQLLKVLLLVLYIYGRVSFSIFIIELHERSRSIIYSELFNYLTTAWLCIDYKIRCIFIERFRQHVKCQTQNNVNLCSFHFHDYYKYIYPSNIATDFVKEKKVVKVC